MSSRPNSAIAPRIPSSRRPVGDRWSVYIDCEGARKRIPNSSSHWMLVTSCYSERPKRSSFQKDHRLEAHDAHVAHHAQESRPVRPGARVTLVDVFIGDQPAGSLHVFAELRQLHFAFLICGTHASVDRDLVGGWKGMLHHLWPKHATGHGFQFLRQPATVA
jgi:hypothetical protein